MQFINNSNHCHTLNSIFQDLVHMRPPLVHSATVSSLHDVILGRMTSYTRLRLLWPYPIFGLIFFLWLLGRERLLVSGRMTGHNHSHHPFKLFIYFFSGRFPTQLPNVDIKYNDWSMEQSMEGTTFNLNCPTWSNIFISVFSF